MIFGNPLIPYGFRCVIFLSIVRPWSYNFLTSMYHVQNVIQLLGWLKELNIMKWL